MDGDGVQVASDGSGPKDQGANKPGSSTSESDRSASDTERLKVGDIGRTEQMSNADAPPVDGTSVEGLPGKAETDPRVDEEFNEPERRNEYL